MSKYPTFNGLMQNSSNLKPLKTQRRNCCQRFTQNFQDQLWLNCTENTRWIMTCLVLTLTKFYIWLVMPLWLNMKEILNQTTFSWSLCDILRRTLFRKYSAFHNKQFKTVCFFWNNLFETWITIEAFNFYFQQERKKHWKSVWAVSK